MQLQQLDPLHQEDIKNEAHPSIFFNAENYDLAIYRLFENVEQPLSVVSHAFVFDRSENVYRYDRVNQSLVQIDGYVGLYGVLDDLVDKSMRKVDQLTLKVEDLEESLYETLSAIKGWFEIKKELVRMERILAQAIKAHEIFIENMESLNIDSKLYAAFEDIEEHLNRIYRACGMNLAKLDSIYNLYTTLANEKMNSTIYTLTVISAIFLPLNLLVGFFGMNTEGLYFSGNPNGTMMVTSLLGILFVVFFAYIKYKKNML